MTKKKYAYGIMGGTFDPIHYGHLVTAEAARASFNLDKVVFVPSGRPPHKKDKVISSTKDRYIMTMLAVATNPWFEVSRVEIERQGFSYAIDTVSSFNEFYGHDVELYFITGADAILEILSWKNVNKLIEMCHFIAATRPGFNLEATKHLPPEILKKISFMEVPALAISSTDIRNRVKESRPIKYLLPEAVERYIYKNQLYNGD